MITLEQLLQDIADTPYAIYGEDLTRVCLQAKAEIETLQKQVATLHRDKGLLMELCVLKNDALQLAHDNWSDCFHDAVSTCKICKARDADLPKEKT